MYGPDDYFDTTRHPGAIPNTTKSSRMTREDIDRCIARAHRQRAEQLAAWGQKVAQTWRSLFRRPGHLRPTHTRSRDRIVHSTQL